MSKDGRAYGCWVRRRQPGLPGAPANNSDCDMTDNDSTREQRLADALRANLRKRKAQARAAEPPEPAKPKP